MFELQYVVYILIYFYKSGSRNFKMFNFVCKYMLNKSTSCVINFIKFFVLGCANTPRDQPCLKPLRDQRRVKQSALGFRYCSGERVLFSVDLGLISSAVCITFFNNDETFAPHSAIVTWNRLYPVIIKIDFGAAKSRKFRGNSNSNTNCNSNSNTKQL